MYKKEGTIIQNKTNIQELYTEIKGSKRKRLIVYGIGKEFFGCIQKINQFLKILCDDWKTPDYLEEKEAYSYSYEDIINSIDFAIDNDINKIKEGYLNFAGKQIKIYSQDYLAHIDLNKYIVLITTSKFEKAIKRQIESDANLNDIEYYAFSDLQHYEKKCRGLIVERIILPYMEMVKMDYYKKNNYYSETEEYDRLTKTIGEGKCVINFIAFDITTICNLNCKNCVDYIPYLKKHSHYPPSEIISSINKFLDAVDLIYCVSLGSAEVLFHPMIKDILKCLLAKENIERIDLVTNGVLYPKDDELLDILADSKIMIHMSDYGISERSAVSRTVYEEHGIDVRFITNQRWKEQSSIFYDRFLNREQLEYSYLNCDQARVCNHFVTNGKYYSCGKIRRIMELSDFDTSHDYLEMALYSQKELKDMIMKQQLEPYMEACSWCDWNDKVAWVKPGEQLKPIISLCE